MRFSYKESSHWSVRKLCTLISNFKCWLGNRHTLGTHFLAHNEFWASGILQWTHLSWGKFNFADHRSWISDWWSSSHLTAPLNCPLTEIPTLSITHSSILSQSPKLFSTDLPSKFTTHSMTYSLFSITTHSPTHFTTKVLYYDILNISLLPGDFNLDRDATSRSIIMKLIPIFLEVTSVYYIFGNHLKIVIHTRQRTQENILEILLEIFNFHF